MELKPSLQELGLTDYESRVIIASLKEDALTAKSLSKASGVPYSRIYGVLTSLVRKNWLIKGEGRPSTYVAGNIDVILEDHLKKEEKKIDDLRDYISSVRSYKETVMNPSFSIGYGWRSFLERFSKMYKIASSLNGVLGFPHQGRLQDLVSLMGSRFVQGVIFIKEDVYATEKACVVRIKDKKIMTLSFTPPVWLFFFDRKDILIAIPLDPMDRTSNSDIKYLELNNFIMGNMLNEIMGVALRDSKSPEGV